MRNKTILDGNIKYLFYERCGVFEAKNLILDNCEYRIYCDGMVGKYLHIEDNKYRLIPLFPDTNNNYKLGNMEIPAPKLIYYAFNQELDIMDKNWNVNKYIDIQSNKYTNLYKIDNL